MNAGAGRTFLGQPTASVVAFRECFLSLAAQFAKSRAKGDLIELRDCATGEKLVLEGWLSDEDPRWE
jgi:hypothetical protein